MQYNFNCKLYCQNTIKYDTLKMYLIVYIELFLNHLKGMGWMEEKGESISFVNGKNEKNF